VTSRETIYAALFSLVSAVPGLTSASRRVRHWNEVPAAEQPALIMEQVGETAQYQSWTMPPRWVLHVDLALYVNVGGDQQASPQALLNPFIDAVAAALAPPPGQEMQTLGGLVNACRLAGKIEIVGGGDWGPQAVALIPVEILVF
jgi:hypothetical protein